MLVLNGRKVSSYEARFKIKNNLGFNFRIHIMLQTQSDRWAAGYSVEESHTWYCSQNIIRVTKLRRVRWTGHVESTTRTRYSKSILIRIYEWRRSPVRMDVDFQQKFYRQE